MKNFNRYKQVVLKNKLAVTYCVPLWSYPKVLFKALISPIGQFIIHIYVHMCHCPNKTLN